MCHWWDLHKNALPMVFNEEQKQTLQDLTGQIPILLSLLMGIRLDDVGQEPAAPNADYVGKGSSSIKLDSSGREPLAGSVGFTRLLEKLWKSPGVRLVEDQIANFMHNQFAKLHNTPNSVMYVYLAFKDLGANGEYRYQRSMLDCLSNRKAAAGAKDYLDWRYFFVGNDGIGQTTSEIARQIAGRCILSLSADYLSAAGHLETMEVLETANGNRRKELSGKELRWSSSD